MEFRPLEAEDVRYAWAGYKAGNLVDMAAPFNGTDMTADQFKIEFQARVTAHYHGGWTMFAQTKKGFIPVGMVFAFYSHPDPALSPFMIIADIVWFKWASARNKIESAVNFFKKVGIPMIDYARGEVNRKFFEMLAQHGIMRRVGTTFCVVKGEPVAIFETRTT